jgi:hypothetical protein
MIMRIRRKYQKEINDLLTRPASPGLNFTTGGIASFAYGGLTKTVPPAKGPDSQGVETLFRRRYS